MSEPTTRIQQREKKTMSQPDTLQTVVIRRSEEENTCAVIVCHKTRQIQTAHDLKQALTRAVTAWAKTDEGRDVVESNNGDFNVGDVALYEESLQPFLLEAGISGFQIECFCDAFPDPSWDYDDLLVLEDSE
jgi:hypothetical protein